MDLIEPCRPDIRAAVADVSVLCLSQYLTCSSVGRQEGTMVVFDNASWAFYLSPQWRSPPKAAERVFVVGIARVYSFMFVSICQPVGTY
jgi:hypothetical protein